MPWPVPGKPVFLVVCRRREACRARSAVQVGEGKATGDCASIAAYAGFPATVRPKDGSTQYDALRMLARLVTRYIVDARGRRSWRTKWPLLAACRECCGRP